MQTIFRSIIIAVFLVPFVYAKDITVIYNGSPGGTFYTRSDFYANGLKDRGYKVDVLNIFKNAAAADMFNKIDRPALMVWIDALAPVRPLEAQEDNFVALEYTAPLYLCTINLDGNTVGFPKMYIKKPVESIGEFVFIPYKNTGETLNAAIGKEIDLAYLNQGKAIKLQEMGYKCDIVQGIQQSAFVVAKNINLSDLRVDILDIISSESVRHWHQQNQFGTTAIGTAAEELEFVNRSEELWKTASN